MSLELPLISFQLQECSQRPFNYPPSVRESYTSIRPDCNCIRIGYRMISVLYGFTSARGGLSPEAKPRTITSLRVPVTAT